MELFNYGDTDVRFQKKDNKVLFCAKDICQILEIKNVSDACKKLNETQKYGIAITDSMNRMQNTTFLTESGVYRLIFKSQKKEAIQFSDFVCEVILPSIRAHGCYPYIKKEEIKTLSINKNKQININTEDDLHKKVVKFIRKNTGFLLITATLGENQNTSYKRIESWEKGYTKGMPDLVIFDPCKKYHGMCCEFKNPFGTGKLSQSQITVMDKFEKLGYKILVSNDYDEIVINILNYWEDIKFSKRIKCDKCKKTFANQNNLIKHCDKFH